MFRFLVQIRPLADINMAEDLTNVYDIHHPSPSSLKQLVSISIALKLWRHEINEHHAANTLDKLKLKKKISSSALKPLLPSTIFSDIENYTKKIGESIEDWLEHRCKALLDFHRDDPNEVLRDFDDFVCDFNGGIHFARTAKRMMLSDRFSIEEKFSIACMHCFEDDVLRIWPSVSESTKVNLDDIDFDKNPVMYYWICRLTNQLQEIPGFSFDMDDSPEVRMLGTVHTLGWTTAGYFWDRLTPEDRWKGAVNLSEHSWWRFARYALAKLNEQDLDKFMAVEGDSLLPGILSFPNDMLIILSTWKFIKNKLSKNGLVSVARVIFEQETNYIAAVWDESVSSEIWRSFPGNMKQHVIRELLPDSSLFVRNNNTIIKFRSFSFLLAVLSDASFEVRNSFWFSNWRNLIDGGTTKDLSRLMKLCFKDETEIVQFKESTMSKYENISPECSRLLRKGLFEELKNLISLCCPTEQADRNIKRNLLMNDFRLNLTHMFKAELFDEFVKDVFSNNVEEIRNFKIQLISSLDEDNTVDECILFGNYRILMNFVDRFVISRKRAVYLKKRYFPNSFCRHLAACFLPFDIKDNDLAEFIQWCFENNERDIAKFKETLVMDELIPNIIRKKVAQAKDRESRSLNRRKSPTEHGCELDKILDWYFVTPEAVGNFKMRWADVFELLSE